MQNYTIASLNTLGFPFIGASISLRYQAIASYLDKSDIDIINFQEIVTYGNLILLRRYLKSFSFCIYEKGYLGPKGGLLTCSRVPLEYKSYSTFPNKFSLGDKSLVDFIIQKGVLTSTIKGSNITLLNTHMNAVFDEDWAETGKYYKVLKLQTKTFHKILLGLKNNNFAIASGDFNIARLSSLYKILLDIPGIKDIFSSDKPTFHPTKYSAFKKSSCIDYFFVFGDLKKHKIIASEYFLNEKVRLNNNSLSYVSDHLGLKIKVE